VTLKQNPKFPEGINASSDSHFSEFLLLLVAITSTIVFLIVVLSLSIQYLAPLMPFRWEQALTDLAPKEILSETYTQELDSKDKDNLVNAQIALQELGQALTTRMTLDDKITFRFHLIDSDTPNAFATLGGHIFITTKLLNSIKTENGLAMVVAHEMAHIKYRHPIQAIGRGTLIQLGLALFTGNQGSSVVQGLFGSAGLLTLLSFNRDMERESDTQAIELLQLYYGHTQGADEFFQSMNKQSDNEQWAALFTTHPGTQERIEFINKNLSQRTNAAELTTPLDPRLLTLKQDLLAEH
jgi:predicted Zn-dependent protease